MADYEFEHMRVMVASSEEPKSPFLLAQEMVGGHNLRTKEWRVIIATMLMAQAPRAKAHFALWRLLSRWPNPYAFGSMPQKQRDDVKRVIHECGAPTKREREMRNMTWEFMHGTRPPRLKYTRGDVHDAWMIFCFNDLHRAPSDELLMKYVTWGLRERIRMRRSGR